MLHVDNNDYVFLFLLFSSFLFIFLLFFLLFLLFSLLTLTSHLSLPQLMSVSNPSLYSSLSVEELFQKLSINEIQSLDQTYQHDLHNSKSQLQHLVTSKYRDIISIIDEIGDTYELTNDLESQLSKFTYKSAKFIPFTSSNSFSHKNSLLLDQDINNATPRQRNTIIHQILNDVLLRLDLNLPKTGTRARAEVISPLVHTSNYIFYGKLFHTLATISTSLPNPFLTIKSNLSSFLQHSIAHYNISADSLYVTESDKFEPSQLFKVTSVLSSIPVNMMDETEYDLEGVLNDSSTLGNYNFIDTETSDSTEEYNTSALPIVNYLVAYIILNSHGQDLTLSKILFQFLDFRFDHLKRVLNDTFSMIHSGNISNINFLNIFKYIENTFGYAAKYFQKQNNDMMKTLKLNTNNWHVGKFLNHHNWFDETITFNSDIFQIQLPKSSIDDMKTFQSKFLHLVFDFINDVLCKISQWSTLDMALVEVNQHLTIFINLTLALNRLQSFATNNGFESHLIQFICQNQSDNIISMSLNLVISKISTLYDNHLKFILTNSPNLVEKINSNINNPNTNELRLFTPDLVSVMDKDIPQYLDIISMASSNPTYSLKPRNEDTVNLTIEWFETNSNFNNVVDLNGGKSEIHKLVLYFKHHETRSWGDFSIDVLEQEFSKLKSSMSTSFFKEVLKLIKEIKSLIKLDSMDVSKTYFIIRDLIIIKQQLPNTEEGKPLIKEIEQECKQFFSDIIKEIPSIMKSFNFTLDDIINSIIENPKETTIPSLKLSSLMFYLSNQLLNPTTKDYEGGFEFGTIFLELGLKQEFSQQKDQWIRNELINKMIEKVDNNSSPNVVKSLFCNIMFCSCFLQESIDSEMVELFCKEEVLEQETKEQEKKEQETKEQETKEKETKERKVPEQELRTIIANVKNHYSAAKHSYFPLNA